MIRSACARSVEKFIKRFPGIRKALVDVLNNRAQEEAIEDAGFEATLLQDEMNERFVQVCRIRINGMTSTSCSSTVESALQAIQGILKALVALATEEAEVHYNPDIISYNHILEAIQETGFQATLLSSGEDIGKIDLKIDGICTDDSMRLIGSSLQALPGVLGIEIYPELSRVSLSYKPDVTGSRNFINVVEETGSRRFKAQIFHEEGRRDTQTGRNQTISQILLMELGLYGSSLSYVHALHVYPSNYAWTRNQGCQYAYCRGDFKMGSFDTSSVPHRLEILLRLLQNIMPRFCKHGCSNCLGDTAACFYSVSSVLRTATSSDFMGTDFFETNAMVISFILLGKYLEVLAKGKTSNVTAKLTTLAPETAILLLNYITNSLKDTRESRSFKKFDRIMYGGKE